MRRSLGKGLSQLIAEQFEGGPVEVPIEQIVPNARQPRTFFDEDALAELAESIRQHGILQPLAVRPIGEEKYELIAGERRLRAAKLAGLEAVPVVQRSASAQDSLELALIENIQREDISPLEAAAAYRKLMDEFELTQEEIAKRVGKGRSVVANTLRLLRLPSRAKDALEAGLITEGHARALLAVEDPAKQLALLDAVIERGLTTKETERLAQATKDAPAAETAPPKAYMDANLKAVQDALGAYFATQVKLQPSAKGGKLVIEYYGNEDLDRILEVLGIRL